MASTLKHVCSSARDLCDVADAVEKIYGFGVCVVSLSTVGPNALYIDKRFPTWERAYEYARELIQWPATPCNCGDAICESTPGHCGAYDARKVG
jgi:hypothetical protein